MREVEGGAAVYWENERHRAQAERGVERNGEKCSLIALAASSSASLFTCTSPVYGEIGMMWLTGIQAAV